MPDNESRYREMLKQDEEITLTNLVATSENDDIYSYEFEGVKRYYTRMSFLLHNRYNYVLSGTTKTERFDGKIFFPNMIFGKIEEYNAHPSFYVEINKDIFEKLHKNGYKRLNNSVALARNIMKDINVQDSSNIIQGSVVKKSNKEDKLDAVETVKGIEITDIQVSSKDDSLLSQPLETSIEKTVVSGKIPLNYNELLESLNIQGKYGSLYADSIESDIKQFVIGATYEFEVPVKTVVEIRDKEPSISEIEANAYKAFYKKIRDAKQIFDNTVSNAMNAIDKKIYLFDPSKIHDFRNAVEEGCISINTDKNIPPDYLRTRLKQAACFMEYTEPKFKEEYPDDTILKFDKAKRINEEKPGTFYLGDELVVKFFVKNIQFPNANYDYPDSSYVPLLSGVDANGNPYNGLMDRQRYIYMFNQNIIMLFPGLEVSEIDKIHYDVLINYCDKIIKEGSKK